MFSHFAPPFFIETYAFSCSVILPGQLIRKWLQERSILQPLYIFLCFPSLKITPTELFQISETDFSPGGNFQVTWSLKKSCGHSRAVSPEEKMPAWQMYIFFLFFQFTMIPETTKDPGSICTIASASQVFLICIILPVTFIQSIFCPYLNFTLWSCSDTALSDTCTVTS